MTTESGDLPPSQPHPLTQITGITPNRQRLLADVLGIKTVQDLAESSAQSIQVGLKTARHTVAIGKVAEWIAEAQDLLAEGTAPPPPLDKEAETPPGEAVSAADSGAEDNAPAADPADSPSPDSGPEDNAPTVDSVDSPSSTSAQTSAASDPAGPATTEQWYTHASFVVEIQTRLGSGGAARQMRVSCRETGETAVLAEADEASLQTWILDRLQREVQPPETQPPDVQPSEAQLQEMTLTQEELAVTVNVRQVAMAQPPEGGIPLVVLGGDRSLPNPLLANRPFDLTLAFTMPALETMPVPDQSRYRLSGFAKPLTAPHQVIPLGDGQWYPLDGHCSGYSVGLPSVVLPTGLYRLQLVISFQGIAIPFGIHEIQRFQVV